MINPFAETSEFQIEIIAPQLIEHDNAIRSKIDEIKKLIDLLKKLDKAISILNSIDFKNLRLKKRANMRIFPVIRKILFFV